MNSCNIGLLGGIHQLIYTSDYLCENLGKGEGFTIELRVIFTNASLDGKFYCQMGGYDLDSGYYTEPVKSRSINLTTLKVKPKRLEMAIDPKEPVEGKEFPFTCTSEEGHPTSTYNYTINGKNAKVNKYTPMKKDRDGLNVSCTDIKHQYWKGRDTYKSKKIVPKYLEIVGELEMHLLRNLTILKLNCSEYVAGNPKPTTFKWKRRGVINNVSSSSLILTPLLTSTTERIDCEVENGIGKAVVISWHITWSINKDFLQESFTVSQPEESTTRNASQRKQILIVVLAGSVCCRWKNRDTELTVIRRPLPTVPHVTTSRRELQSSQRTHLSPVINEAPDTEDYLNPTPSEYIDLIQSGEANADDNYESLF